MADTHVPLTCQVCGKTMSPGALTPVNHLHGGVLDRLKTQLPGLQDDGFVCLDDVNLARRDYIASALSADNSELSVLEQEVARSVKENEVAARDLNSDFDNKLSVGDRIADKVAEFGGSWRFIIIFGSILLVWIVLNTTIALLRFDPPPFILLNLVLSCVAAMQAPVIMMSQNRQEAKDRLRAEQDFRTNLKAELEVRNLNTKIDELLTHQWQRLLEIQQLQTEMMEELMSHRTAREAAAAGTPDA